MPVSSLGQWDIWQFKFRKRKKKKVYYSGFGLITEHIVKIKTNVV